MSKHIQELSNNQLIEIAPAIGATAPHSDVSEWYSFVPTTKAVDLLRDSGWLPVSAEQSSVRSEEREGFQKHMIRFIQPHLDAGSERVDLVLFNSHDRGCAFKLIASVWRKVCGNGLMVASELANFSHRHVGFKPEIFVESAQVIADQASEISYQVNDMKVIDLSPDERGVFALSAHSLLYDDAEQAPIRPDQLLKERRYDDKGKDLWSTFNVIQENVMKGGIRGSRFNPETNRIQRTSTRKVKSLDRNIKLNQALWTLTEKMAELKAN